ncbi:MAG TPA: hypothetical protein P5531_01225 [Bacteroidales bacterium]|nr:hypothetical protein [Bacteroidales bacterium]HSA42276.1 hypothetical protein [Bacteroidales bacterium]
MKKIIFICILSVALLLPGVQHTYGQRFSSGGSDGYDAAVSVNFLPLSPLKCSGGLGDGYASAETLYMGYVTAGKFSGGNADGYSSEVSAVWLSTVLSKFAGGAGDGFASYHSLFTARVIPVICHGGNTGEIHLLPTGTLQPYQYIWSTGAVTSSLTGLPAGSYTVTVSDLAGNKVSANFLVTEPASLPPAPQVTTPFVYCQFDDALPLTALGDELLWYESQSGGIGNPAAPIPQTLVPGTVYFFVSQTVNTCESERAAIAVIVNPISVTTVQDTICTGDSIFLAGAYQFNSGTYYDTLVSVHGCDSTIVTSLVVLPCGARISGSIRYKNPAGTALKNTTVYLRQGNAVVAQTLTDVTGHYAFQPVESGIYSLTASTMLSWGGVNATDGLMILMHFAGVTYLNGLNLTVADVDLTGYVNAIDALITVRRYVELISSYPAGDWIFESGVVVVAENATVTRDLYGLCVGDVNGSFANPSP